MSLYSDFHDLELHFAYRSLHFHNIAHLVAKKSLGNRSGDRDFAFLQIRFSFTNDSVCH